MTTTTQQTHTQGPWHVGIKQAEQIVYDDKGNAIANATTYYFDSTKELCHANARLIASAPELLEALKAFHKHFITEGQQIGEYEEQLEKLSMQAIAKAEGKTL